MTTLLLLLVLVVPSQLEYGVETEITVDTLAVCGDSAIVAYKVRKSWPTSIGMSGWKTTQEDTLVVERCHPKLRTVEELTKIANWMVVNRRGWFFGKLEIRETK